MQEKNTGNELKKVQEKTWTVDDSWRWYDLLIILPGEVFLHETILIHVRGYHILTDDFDGVFILKFYKGSHHIS